MSNFLKKTKRASEEIDYDLSHNTEQKPCDRCGHYTNVPCSFPKCPNKIKSGTYEQLSGTDQVCGKTELNNLSATSLPNRKELFKYAEQFIDENDFDWMSEEEKVRAVDFVGWLIPKIAVR